MASQTKELIGMKPHHVGISVPDLEASIKWYCDTIGIDFENTVGKVNSIPKLHKAR